MKAEQRRWTCPECRSTYAVPGTDPHKARCSKCRDVLSRVCNQVVPLASPPLKPKPVPDPSSVWRPKPPPRIISQDVCVIAAAVGLCAWFLFSSAPRGWDLFSYMGLIAVVAAATLWRLRRTPSNATLITTVGVATGLVALFVFASNDTYEREFDEGDMTVTVVHERWTRVPIYERQLSRHGPFAYAEGPLSASGVRHGEWTIHVAGLPRERVWYWYGERVTEGDWHRRDR